jgi:hypothetical protein
MQMRLSLLDCWLALHWLFWPGAAVKEEQIETKLAGIQADWAGINLVFAEYKTRGPVILKGSDTAELIEKLEDSQMTLGSMVCGTRQGLRHVVQQTCCRETREQVLMDAACLTTCPHATHCTNRTAGHQPLLGTVPWGGPGLDRQAVNSQRDHRAMADGAGAMEIPYSFCRMSYTVFHVRHYEATSFTGSAIWTTQTSICAFSPKSGPCVVSHHWWQINMINASMCHKLGCGAEQFNFYHAACTHGSANGWSCWWPTEHGAPCICHAARTLELDNSLSRAAGSYCLVW